MPPRVKKRTDTATNRESDRIIVRLPAGMRDRLHEIAEHNGRSMTAEVVEALNQWIAREDGGDASAKTLDTLMELQAQQIAEIGQLRMIIEAKMTPPPPPRAPDRTRAEGLDAVAAALSRGDAKGALLAIAEMPDLSVPTRFLDKYLQKRKAKTPQT